MIGSGPAAGQWSKIAASWKLIGSPLRPIDEDLAFVRSTVEDWDGSKPPRVLILGVTPELHDLPWPRGATVRAVDRSMEMLSHVWPGEPSAVLRADWRELAFADNSFDLVLCDGGWSLLDPPGQRRLADHLARIIATRGRFVTRLFVPPEQRESAQVVIDDLLAGRVRDLNILKLRLGMALSPSAEEGVELDAVWRLLRDAGGSWPDLAATLGWELAHLSAIDAYRGSSARYHFVSVPEFAGTCCQGTLELETVDVPGYPLGERCPTVTVRNLA